MNEQFTQQDMPLPSTFAFRVNAPCRVEHPSQPAPTADRSSNLLCPYFHECHAISALTMLRRTYGRHIRVTLAEASSSIVVRSENLFNRDERHRLTLRKHLYEVREGSEEEQFLLADGTIEGFAKRLHCLKRRDDSIPLDDSLIVEVAARLRGLLGQTTKRPQRIWANARDFETAVGETLSPLRLAPAAFKVAFDALRWFASSPTACLPIAKNLKFAKYLGFVDLRTHSPLSPISHALLVPPRDLRHDRNARIITGNYARLFGGDGFRSTVYSMHDPESGGAHCAQACLIMVLSMLADRGARMHGSYDLTFFAEHTVPAADMTDDDQRKKLAEAGVRRIFKVRGLHQAEMANILNNAEWNASADSVFLPFDGGTNWTNLRVAKRLLDAYVLARCPVILLVDPSKWWDAPSGNGHAVVVVGVRRGRAALSAHGPRYIDEVTELIVHDPGDAPFVIRPVDHCLDASVALGPVSTPAGRRGFNLLLASDANVKRHAHDCVNALYKHALRDWIRYIFVPEEPTGELRDSVRGKMGASRETDYELRLVHRDDVSRAFLSPEYDHWTARKKSRSIKRTAREEEHWQRFRRVDDSMKVLERGWYWCIAGYDKSDLEVLWMFSATGPIGGKWDFRIDFRPGRRHAPADSRSAE
jgi:hypothetical protein